jgi:putative transposase
VAKVCRISEVSPSGYYEWMICSMNRTGTPYGNDCAETFFNTIKLEMIYQEHVKQEHRLRQPFLNILRSITTANAANAVIGNIPPYEFRRRYYVRM